MKQHLKINGNNIFTIVVFTTIVCSLLSTYPFIFSQFLPLPSVIITTIGTILILATLLFFKKNLKTFIPSFNIIVLIQIVAWMLFAIYHTDSSYITRIAFIVTAYLSLLALHNCNGGLLRFTKLYNNAILVMAVSGMLCFFIVLLFSFQPLFEFQNPDERTAYFFGLTCTNTYIGDVMRYAGFFDEPGAMAYWGIFALLFNRLFFHNSIYEKILIVSLAFTFSLAYYIQLAFYFILFKAKKIYHYLIATIILAIALFIVLSFENSEYEYIYNFTVARMEYDNSNGTLEGDNRQDMAINARKQFIKTPIMGVGAQHAKDSNEEMDDNPFEILAKDGIIGFIVTYLPLILVLVLRFGSRELLFTIFILAVGYMQRPFHVNCMHWFMLYMFVLCLLEKNHTNLKTAQIS